ncbi:MAG: hypothetical protein P8127_13055 [Acidobacteriota bacterium]
MGDLGGALCCTLDLRQEKARFLMARDIQQHLVDLFSSEVEITFVKSFDRLHQQAVDDRGSRCLKLFQNVVEIDLRSPRRQLLVKASGGREGGVEPEHELETDESFLLIPLLELSYHLLEGGHDSILGLLRELGVPGIRHVNDGNRQL